MYQVHLHEAGGLYEVVSVYSLPEASAAATAWQAKHGFGNSQLGVTHGKIYGPSMEPFHVSYNGRVWQRETLVYDPSAK